MATNEASKLDDYVMKRSHIASVRYKHTIVICEGGCAHRLNFLTGSIFNIPCGWMTLIKDYCMKASLWWMKKSSELLM